MGIISSGASIKNTNSDLNYSIMSNTNAKRELTFKIDITATRAEYEVCVEILIWSVV